MSAFSAIFVLKVNGTQSHSAKFLNWGDHVNSVPDLAASPPWLLYWFFIGRPDLSNVFHYSSFRRGLERDFEGERIGRKVREPIRGDLYSPSKF